LTPFFSLYQGNVYDTKAKLYSDKRRDDCEYYVYGVLKCSAQ
jgi:hypothetical protein